jgi:hypothetical protein
MLDLEFPILKLYRQEPGDAGVKDVPVIDGEDYEKAAGARLLSFFNDKATRLKPHHARVVGRDGRVIVEVQVTLDRGQPVIQRVAARAS